MVLLAQALAVHRAGLPHVHLPTWCAVAAPTPSTQASDLRPILKPTRYIKATVALVPYRSQPESLFLQSKAYVAGREGRQRVAISYSGASKRQRRLCLAGPNPKPVPAVLLERGDIIARVFSINQVLHLPDIIM